MANYYGVNPAWIMGYDVPMDKSVSHENGLDKITMDHIENYNKLNSAGKQVADIYVKSLTKVPEYTEKT